MTPASNTSGGKDSSDSNDVLGAGLDDQVADGFELVVTSIE